MLELVRAHGRQREGDDAGAVGERRERRNDQAKIDTRRPVSREVVRTDGAAPEREPARAVRAEVVAADARDRDAVVAEADVGADEHGRRSEADVVADLRPEVVRGVAVKALGPAEEVPELAADID